jgi:DNA-binding XRE family transcriptional regulator
MIDTGVLQEARWNNEGSPTGVNNIDKELAALGRNICRARRALNISQAELAFRCGLHRTYLSGIERGARNPSFASLLAVARGLGSNVSELTRDIGGPLGSAGGQT